MQHYLWHCIFILALMFGGITAAADCKTDAFLDNARFRDRYRVKYQPVQPRPESANASTLWGNNTHFIECLDKYRTEHVTSPSPISAIEKPPTTHLILQCSDNGQWMRADSEIGVMASCQKREWIEPGFMETTKHKTTLDRMFPMVVEEGNYVELRALIEWDSADVGKTFFTSFYNNLRSGILIDVAAMKKSPCKLKSKSERSFCYQMAINSTLQLVDGSKSLGQIMYNYENSKIQTEWYFRCESAGAAKNIISYGIIDEDGNDREIQRLAGVDGLFIDHIRTETTRKITHRKLELVTLTSIGSYTTKLTESLLTCLREQIRLRRFYDIDRECYGGKSYDDGWLERCCDKILSVDILDTNALIEAIAKAKDMKPSKKKEPKPQNIITTTTTVNTTEAVITSTVGTFYVTNQTTHVEIADEEKSIIWIVVGVISGVVVIILVAIAVYCIISKRCKPQLAETDSQFAPYGPDSRMVDLKAPPPQKATRGRNNEISETTTMNTDNYSGRRRQRSDIPSESKSSYYGESETTYFDHRRK